MNKLQRNAREARVRRLQKEQQRLFRKRIEDLATAVSALRSQVEFLTEAMGKVGIFVAGDAVDKLTDTACVCGHGLDDHPIPPAMLPSGQAWPCVGLGRDAGSLCRCSGFRGRGIIAAMGL